MLPWLIWIFTLFFFRVYQSIPLSSLIDFLTGFLSVCCVYLLFFSFTCIFWPAFGCCALHTLVEICIFNVFCANKLKTLKGRNLLQNLAKNKNSLFPVTSLATLAANRSQIYYLSFILSILIRLDYSAAIQELFRFLGIETKHTSPKNWFKYTTTISVRCGFYEICNAKKTSNFTTKILD